LSRAVDTNVVVRYLTGDDPDQSAVATTILREDFMLTATVLVETEWVLRSAYRWPRLRIAAALEALVDLPGANCAVDGVGWALARMRTGADLADMVHILMAAGASGFATFDTRLAAAAGADAPLTIETLA
tara:strand:- start:709 stop:1098 length:390 start_codon:yes stop_codon:yes gene_type:complete